MSALSIVAAAEEAPDADALVVEGATLSFPEVAERVLALGASLPPAEEGASVALTPRLEASSLCAMLACIERGLPMLLLPSRFTAPERARALAQVSDAWGSPPRVWEELTRASTSGPGQASSTLALVLTSGTTGTPRVASLSRAAFLSAAHASEANLGWQRDDRWLLTMPPAHVGGLSILVRCLMARRAVVLADSPQFDPAQLAHQLERDRVTLLSLVPTMLRRLLDHDPRWRPPSALRAVLVGGAAFPPELAREARERGLPTLATYGMTETCAQLATQPYARRGLAEVGVGPALPGLSLRVRDGRIEASGPTLMDGYLGVSDHEQPFTDDGWLRTGDLGQLDGAGWLQVLGRADDLILSGGENVAPREVEAALLTLPGVRDACVFGQADSEWGQRVCAALVLDATAAPLATLLSGLRATLAGHKLPRGVALLDALPSSAKGGVDRPRVARLALAVGLHPWLPESP